MTDEKLTLTDEELRKMLAWTADTAKSDEDLALYEVPDITSILTELLAYREAVKPWQDMACEAQLELATRIAANVGYQLIPEPQMNDELPFITATSARPDYYVTVKVHDIEALHAAHDRVLEAFGMAGPRRLAAIGGDGDE